MKLEIQVAEVLKKANTLLESPTLDDTTRNEIQSMMSNDPKGLLEAFYSDLEFGTGGLRGIMGVGTMLMNK